MDIRDLTIADLGMEYAQTPIKQIRIHRTDGKWKVEYKKAKIRLPWDYFWWYSDGTFLRYQDAVDRATDLKHIGFVVSLRYKQDIFDVD